MFGSIKSYFSGLNQRFVEALPRDKGTIIGGIIGAAYTSIRSLYTESPINIPLAGNTDLITSASSRFILGTLVGGIAGSNFGNRYGQIAEQFLEKPKQPPQPMNNQTFMMYTSPFIFGVAANIIMFCFDVPGGSPFFGSTRELSTAELYILATLNGLFVGGTIGYRGGKFIDFVTGGKLIADFGLYSGYKRLTNKEPAGYMSLPAFAS